MEKEISAAELAKQALAEQGITVEVSSVSAAEIAKQALAEQGITVEVSSVSAAELGKQDLKLKETKEFVKGAIALAKVISSEMHDGFQSSDLINIARKLSIDAAFRETVWEAAKGVQSIPQELKDANVADIAIEIGSIVLDSLKA